MDTEVKEELTMTLDELAEVLRNRRELDEEVYQGLRAHLPTKKRNQIFLSGNVKIDFFLNPGRIVDSIRVYGSKSYNELVKNNPVWMKVAELTADKYSVNFVSTRGESEYHRCYTFVSKKCIMDRALEEGDDLDSEISYVHRAQEELDKKVEKEIRRINLS